jgi:hypothetical protein
LIITKVCTRCEQEKFLEEFNVSTSRGLHGKTSRCKNCMNERRRELRALHPERHSEAEKSYRARNPEKVRQKEKRQYDRKREEKLASKRLVYSLEPEKYRARTRDWTKTNPDKMRAQNVNKYWANRERFLEENRRWRLENPGRCRALSKHYKLSKMKAVPPWLTADQKRLIHCIYIMADVLSNFTGIPHHVDHFHPLRGKTVCGLHVPWNLRVIPAYDNMSKGNRLAA